MRSARRCKNADWSLVEQHSEAHVHRSEDWRFLNRFGKPSLLYDRPTRSGIGRLGGAGPTGYTTFLSLEFEMIASSRRFMAAIPGKHSEYLAVDPSGFPLELVVAR